jgi:hypothetical protein
MDVQGGGLEGLGDGIGTGRSQGTFNLVRAALGSPDRVNLAGGVARQVPVNKGLVVPAVPFPPAGKLLEASKNKGTPCHVAINVEAG